DVGADRIRVPDGVLVGADERLEVARRAEREAERTDAETGRLREGGRAAARHPERRVRARPGLGKHVARRHGEEPALVAVRRLAPHAEDLAQRLVEHAARGLAVGDAEALELGRGGAAAGAELEAALGEVVEHGDALGDARRVVDGRGQVPERRADVDARGARGDEGQHDLRGGEVRVLLEEVVLDRPDVLEAVAVRGLGQLDLAEEARVRGAAGVGLDLVARDVRLDEEAELHPAAPSRARARLSNRGARCYGVIGDGMELRELRQMLRNAGGSGDPMLRDMARQLAAWDFTGVTLTPPTTLIEDRLELDLDGVAVRLIYVGPAHTAGDVIVHLPAARVVFTGDILFRLCTPIGW